MGSRIVAQMFGEPIKRCVEQIATDHDAFFATLARDSEFHFLYAGDEECDRRRNRDKYPNFQSQKQYAEQRS